MRFFTLIFLISIMICFAFNQSIAQTQTTTKISPKEDSTQIDYKKSKSLELLHILIALTPYNNSNQLLNIDSASYKKAIFYFSRFKHFKIVKVIHRTLLRKGYQALALEFIQYDFEPANLKKSPFIRKNFYDLQYFLKESDFFKFLETNTGLFEHKAKQLSLNRNLKSYSDWFKTITQNKPASYTFIVSPLVNKSYLFVPTKTNGLKEALFIGRAFLNKINFQLFQLKVQLYLAEELKALNKRILNLVRKDSKKWLSEADKIDQKEATQVFTIYLSAVLYEIYAEETAQLGYEKHQKEIQQLMALNTFDAYPRFRRKCLKHWKNSKSIQLSLFLEELLLSLEETW